MEEFKIVIAIVDNVVGYRRLVRNILSASATFITGLGPLSNWVDFLLRKGWAL